MNLSGLHFQPAAATLSGILEHRALLRADIKTCQVILAEEGRRITAEGTKVAKGSPEMAAKMAAAAQKRAENRVPLTTEQKKAQSFARAIKAIGAQDPEAAQAAEGVHQAGSLAAWIASRVPAKGSKGKAKAEKVEAA